MIFFFLPTTLLSTEFTIFLHYTLICNVLMQVLFYFFCIFLRNDSYSSRYHSQLQVSNLNSASNLLEVSREFQERAKYTGEVEVEFDVKVKGLPKSHYLLLLLLTAWINALGNGVLPSIQSYSCLPYGIEVCFCCFVSITL